MRKIPTLFKREFVNHNVVNILPEVTEGCEWVLNGEGIATRKWDGTCCCIMDGKLYKRYDAKHGKPIPDGAIPCQAEADAVTGHLPCWVLVSFDNPADKWFAKAYTEQIEQGYEFKEGTYELCGIHFQGNPEGFSDDHFIRHGEEILNVSDRTFEGIRKFLEENKLEGIVFHRGNGDMCKIKRSDFRLPWRK